MFFSKSTNGFYDPKIHGKNMPADVIEIDDATYKTLMADQFAGKQITSDENGFPISIDPPEPPIDVIIAQKWESIKLKRDLVKSGGALVAGSWFHSDDSSRIQQLGLKDRARDALDTGGSVADQIVIGGDPVMWKTMGGNFVPMTIQLAFEIVAAIGILDKNAFSVAEYHRAQMSASADPASYDFSAGWPPSFQD